MTTTANDAENLSRIREILLGSQLENFENDLLKTKEEVSASLQSLENTIQHLQDQHQLDLQNLTDELLKQTTELSGRITSAANSVQELRLAMESSFERISSKLGEEVAGLKTLIEKNRQLVNEQSMMLAEVELKLTRLQNTSVDKKRLSAVLNQLAMELLKGEEDE